LLGVLNCANAYENWNDFNNSIEYLSLDMIKLDYVNQFKNLKSIKLDNLTQVASCIELPNLENLSLNFSKNELNSFTVEIETFKLSKKLKCIEIRSAFIKDGLSGLNYFRELEKLSLIECDCNDVNTLETVGFCLNIKHLVISCIEYIKLKSLKGLENCKNLSFISIYKVGLEDTTALFSLENIEYLHIKKTNIKFLVLPEDLGKLKAITLTHSPIEKISKTKLPEEMNCIKLTNINIDNIDFISGVKILNSFVFNKCDYLKNLKGFSNLQSLDFFEINGCFNLNDINDILNKDFNFYGFWFKNIPPNIIPNKLNTLAFRNLESCEGIEQFRELEILDLSNSEIKDLKGLSKLKKLKSLNLENCEQLITLDGIEELSFLEILNINGTSKLLDIKALDHIYINKIYYRDSNFKRLDFPIHLHHALIYNGKFTSMGINLDELPF
jgi:hypothetical protein